MICYKSTRRLQVEKLMDDFTDKELMLMESLAKGLLISYKEVE